MANTRNPAGLPPRWKRAFIGMPLALVLLAGFIAVPAAAALAVYRTAANYWESLPTDLPTEVSLATPSTVLASDGTVIATFYAENRVPVELNEVPEFFIDALIATEDARYWQHHGVDWRGTARAVINNVTGGARQGGSGITQQYVKNLLMLAAPDEQARADADALTVERKLREARYALALEERMSKEEILARYLNTVYFGDGAYGIGAAAQHYFNKSPRALTEGEQALLVGVINNPSAYDPTNDMNASLDRRQHVLARMVAENIITTADAERVGSEPVLLDLVTPANGCNASDFPQYCQQVRDLLLTDPAFGETPQDREALLYRGGLTITTALDPRVQATAEKSLAEALPATGNVATAIAVVQPGTGHVAAIAQNRPFGAKEKRGQTELVYATRPAFQNGSTFKPFTAVTALEAGVSPRMLINAGPTYKPEGRNYPPGGFHNDSDGPGANTDMAGALRNSINTWFIELEDRLGVRAVAETAARLGMTSLPLDAITEKDAALTLGVFETSPLDVANSYATLAAHGKACPAVFITGVTRGSEDLPIPSTECEQVIRPQTADTITALLQGVVEPGGTGNRARLTDGRPQAGKTGTTNDFGAAWFAGYVPQYAAAVWVGDPRGPQFGLKDVTVYGDQTFPVVYGGTAPAVIWRTTMDRVLADVPVAQFTRPGADSILGVQTIVPDVRGYDIAVATRVLADAGYIAVVEDGVVSDPNLPPGVVSRVAPAPGTPLPPGSEVTVNLNSAG